jgi:outer membrane protein OmpA-like peptidoglycan-associated protein
MKRTIKIIFVFLSFSFTVHSQTQLEIRADKAYKQQDYLKAIEKYNAILVKKPLTEKQLLNLANSFYYTSNFENAAKNYKSYNRTAKTLSLEEYNRYLQSLKLSANSKDEITTVINSILDSLPQAVINRYKHSKEKIFSRTTSSYALKNSKVNSSNSDFGVFIFPDSTVMYSSAKENRAYNYIYKKIKQPFINIYKSKLKDDKSIDTVSIKKYVEKSLLHSSSPFYDTIYKRFFYTQSEKEKNKLKFKNSQSNFRIVYGVMDENNQLKNLNYYPKKNNGYSYGQPFFDAKTNRLYFVSNMPNGFGGTDIYYVEMDAQGITSAPVNLGEKINSFANEMFPSITNDHLYFSSNLFIGKGGLDVYSSKYDDGEFQYPAILDGAINSLEDDFAFQIIESTTNQKKGYLSSNREGGKGSDDIYSFTENKKIKEIEITGTTKQLSKDSTFIPNATITISILKGAFIKTIQTDISGRYTVLLPINNDYNFKAEKENYIAALDTLLLSKVQNINPISKDFYLKKELIPFPGGVKINLENIYFNFDESNITPLAEQQLTVAINYFRKYPTKRFKLEAHTDSRGAKDYNLALSYRRAKTVQDYLLSKGVSADRIDSVKGYGETKLMNDCNGIKQCTDAKHLENRRTDFVISPDNKN